MIASAMNTNTADTTIGIHNAVSPTMTTSRILGEGSGPLRNSHRLEGPATKGHEAGRATIHHVERDATADWWRNREDIRALTQEPSGPGRIDPKHQRPVLLDDTNAPTSAVGTCLIVLADVPRALLGGERQILGWRLSSGWNTEHRADDGIGHDAGNFG